MRNIGKLTAVAATAVVAGGSALLLKEKLAKPSGAGAGCSPNNPVPHAGSGAEMGRIARVAERLRKVWPDVTGESGPMPEAALEIAISQAFLESGVAEAGGGGWWKDKSGDGTGGNMVGSGNLGARQCGINDAGGDYYTCVEYGDSAPNADGTQTYFPAKFRYYKAGTVGGKQRDAGDAAAYDFLYSIVRQWPALAELKSGDVLAYAIRQGPKYRKADPPNQKVFGREYKGGNGYYGGFGATMQDRVGSYGRAIVSHLPAVAAALGHKKIYACIAPELLAGGATHAAVSGGCCGGPDPEDILLVHSLNDDPFASDAAAEMAEKNIEGAGVAVATAVATAVLATGAGTLLSHHLDKSKPRVVIRLPKEMVRAAQKKKQGAKKKAPESSPPPLDEDRGSIAALTASSVAARSPRLLPGTRRDPASGDVYHAAPLQVATAPLQVATSAPELSDDRGSLAALRKIPSVTVTVPGQLVPVSPPSTRLPREDIKQMFPTYTESQIDDALNGLQGTGASVEGVVSPTVAAVAAFASGAVVGASGLLLAQSATSRRDNAPTITPEPPPPIAPPPAKQPRTYVVKAGDSPFKIAVASDAAKRPRWWDELTKANSHKETTGVLRGWKQLLPGETIIIPAEWSAGRSVEGAVQVEGIGTIATIVAALVAGGAYAANAVAERDANVLVQALRSHGIDVTPPGTQPSAGYIPVSDSDPAVQEALSKLSPDSQTGALRALRSMLDSGFGLRAYSATLASGEQAADILSSPPVQAASAAIARAASIQGVEPTVSFRLDGDAACPCQKPCSITAAHVHATCPESKRIGETRDMRTIDAIVPAYNEETTVAGVAKALMASGQFGRVIVVDDGSTDGTAKEAAASGAEVISLPSNGGKTAAMFAGVAASSAPDIAFFDADATVILPEHAKKLVDAYRSGDYAQVCGTLDGEYSNGAILNTSRLGTGERIVSRRVLDSVPVTCGGYTAETAINYAADKLGKTHTVRLSGLTLRHKTDKKGMFAGTVDNVRMIGEMAAARFALAVSGGKSCNLAGAADEVDVVNVHCGQPRCPVNEPHSHVTYGAHLSGDTNVTQDVAATSDARAAAQMEEASAGVTDGWQTLERVMLGKKLVRMFNVAVSGHEKEGQAMTAGNGNPFCGGNCLVNEPHSHATYGMNLSGEKDVTPESAAASDAYATRAHVEGAGKIVAAVATTAATVASAAYLVHRDHQRGAANMTARVDMLKSSLRKHGWDLIKETDPVPPGYILAFGSLAMEPGLYAAIEEYEKASGTRDGMRMLEQLATGTRLIRKDDTATVEGAGTVAAVAASVLAAGAAGYVASAVHGRMTERPIVPSTKNADLLTFADQLQQQLTKAFGPLGIQYVPAGSPIPAGGRVLPWNDPKVMRGLSFMKDDAKAYAESMSEGAKNFPDKTPRLVQVSGPDAIEGAGTVAAVVAGGLTAGALAALALSAASKTGDAPAPVSSVAPAAPVVTWSAPAPKAQQPKADAQKSLKQLQSELTKMLTPDASGAVKASPDAIAAKSKAVNAAKAALDATPAAPVAAPSQEDVKANTKTSAQLDLIEVQRKLSKAKAELAAMLTPDTSGALSADQATIASKSKEVEALQKRENDISFLLSGADSAWALSVSGMVNTFDSETGHGTVLPLDGSAEVHFNAPTASVGEFVQFEPVQEDGQSSAIRGTGDSLLALRLSGTLPMARAVPGSGGSRVVWYVEKPRAAESAPIGGTAAAPVRFTRVVRPLRLVGVGDGNLFCGGNCAVNEPHSHAAPVGATRDDEPDAADKAMASASDAADAVSSLINAVAKGKRAIARQAAIEDPKCRKAVRMFVEKHPLVARWFAPELRDMAGVDIGCACNSVGAADIESFADRYADELTRQRAGRGYEGAECEPSSEEDRAVLGALMAPLGLSKEEEDGIYTAASRTAATALDMYLPGAGARATEASDAISQLITGRKMAPHSATPQAPAPKAPVVDQTKKLKVQLAAEKAKVAVAKQFATKHPYLVAWFNPDLRTL